MFDTEASQAMRKVMKIDNTCVIALLNGKYLVYKVLGVVIYRILEKHVCIDYLCLQK